jgi:preprotein translocase subunit SecF
MQILNKTNIDFLRFRYIPMILSAILVVVSIGSFFTLQLNRGLDFSGGTLVELAFNKPVDINTLRKQVEQTGVKGPIVQHIGRSEHVMIRIPLEAGQDSNKQSNQLIRKLREQYGERLVESRPDQDNQCIVGKASKPGRCQIQERRAEFVGPQIGEELVRKGVLALIGSIVGILIYVMFRFEWRFAVASIVATTHDVILVFGFFSIFQLEFNLPVLAAMLAILGYSLNDTIVVFDRIRENFRRLRKRSVREIMNASLNETLSRTIVTSLTTLVVVLALYFYGGEIMRGFAIALIVGIFVGTYSSIFIATPTVLLLGISRDDMQTVKKEGAEKSKSSSLFMDYE